MAQPTPLAERVKKTVIGWYADGRFKQNALAKRLGVAPSAIHRYVSGTSDIPLDLLEAAAELSGAHPAEALLAGTDELKVLRPHEAQLLRAVRDWPVSVTESLLSFVAYFHDEAPAEPMLRQTHELLRRMPVEQRQLIHAYALMLREGGLPPDVRAALGIPETGGGRPTRAKPVKP
jgi:transcriptional regulator with XRE-family HTH domain